MSASFKNRKARRSLQELNTKILQWYNVVYDHNLIVIISDNLHHSRRGKSGEGIEKPMKGISSDI